MWLPELWTVPGAATTRPRPREVTGQEISPDWFPPNFTLDSSDQRILFITVWLSIICFIFNINSRWIFLRDAVIVALLELSTIFTPGLQSSAWPTILILDHIVQDPPDPDGSGCSKVSVSPCGPASELWRQLWLLPDLATGVTQRPFKMRYIPKMIKRKQCNT